MGCFALLGVTALGCTRSAPAAVAPKAVLIAATPVAETPSGAKRRVPIEGIRRSLEPTVGFESAQEQKQEPDASAGAKVAPSTSIAREVAIEADPKKVIESANAAALQGPDAAAFDNAVMNYSFIKGGIYRVFSSVFNVTDIALQPGESLIGEPAAGDKIRWNVSVGESISGGLPQTHIFLKPKWPGLATSLVFTTDRRTYYLRPESFDETHMVGVTWDYPEEATMGFYTDVSLPERVESTEPSGYVDPAQMNADYSVQVVSGQPSWGSVVVYDDGKKTYLRFGDKIRYGESPVFFKVVRGERQVANYHVEGSLYVIHGLFREAHLVLGQDEQDVVAIRRR